MKHSISVSIIVAIMSIGIASTSTTSQAAQDLKVLHGSICQTKELADEQFFKRDNNGITNISSSGQWVICPLVRDNVGESKILDFVRLFIRQAKGRTTYCKAATVGNFGGTIFSKEANIKDVQTKYYELLEDATTATHGGYYVECKLAANASLVNILYTD